MIIIKKEEEREKCAEFGVSHLWNLQREKPSCSSEKYEKNKKSEII